MSDPAVLNALDIVRIIEPNLGGHDDQDQLAVVTEYAIRYGSDARTYAIQRIGGGGSAWYVREQLAFVDSIPAIVNRATGKGR